MKSCGTPGHMWLPLAALAGRGNNIIYTGSFSKILFPGLRIGWVLADQELISLPGEY